MAAAVVGPGASLFASLHSLFYIPCGPFFDLGASPCSSAAPPLTFAPLSAPLRPFLFSRPPPAFTRLEESQKIAEVIPGPEEYVGMQSRSRTKFVAASTSSRCTSHLTPHTSHLTPHTSHLTSHTMRHTSLLNPQRVRFVSYSSHASHSCCCAFT
jgi:hypothetical protein